MRNGLDAFRLFAQMRSWLRAMRRRSRLESDMEAELQLHLEQLTDDLDPRRTLTRRGGAARPYRAGASARAQGRHARFAGAALVR